ncbi:hypothetical protein AWZ03_015217, partial [Drosophila navojoa]
VGRTALIDCVAVVEFGFNFATTRPLALCSGTDLILLFSHHLDPISADLQGPELSRMDGVRISGTLNAASNLMSLSAAAIKSDRDILTGFAGFGLDRVTTGLRLKSVVSRTEWEMQRLCV